MVYVRQRPACGVGAVAHILGRGADHRGLAVADAVEAVGVRPGRRPAVAIVAERVQHAVGEDGRVAARPRAEERGRGCDAAVPRRAIARVGIDGVRAAGMRAVPGELRPHVVERVATLRQRVDSRAVHGARVPERRRPRLEGDGPPDVRAQRVACGEVDDARVGAVVQDAAVVGQLAREHVHQPVRAANGAAAPRPQRIVEGPPRVAGPLDGGAVRAGPAGRADARGTVVGASAVVGAVGRVGAVRRRRGHLGCSRVDDICWPEVDVSKRRRRRPISTWRHAG